MPDTVLLGILWVSGAQDVSNPATARGFILSRGALENVSKNYT